MDTDSAQQPKSTYQINTQPIPQKNQIPQEAVNMELRRKLWEGHLPVKVDLALSDLNNIEAPRSLYVLIISKCISLR